MKLNNLKFIKTKFDPSYHWSQLISAFFIFAIIIAIYGVYTFFYIKNEIVLIDMESKNNVQNSTSTEFLEKRKENNQFLEDIKNLNTILEDFSKKELEYNRLINASVYSYSITQVSTTTASTTVATSTE